MNISNTLRQECMPEMVYSICKLAGSKSYYKEDVKRLITLGNTSKESNDQYNKVYRFAIDCGFIGEDVNDNVFVNFSKKELSCFKAFRYAIFSDVFKNSQTIFTSLTKWYLSQERDIFSVKAIGDLLTRVPQDLGVRSEEYLLGFRFWIVALGLAMMQKAGKGATLVFATNNILNDWIELSNPFEKGKPILANEFFDKLTIDCPLFKCCMVGNDINLALSMGLRVLNLNGLIELKYTTDSGDIWHLTNSISDPKTNNITEIIVR